MGIATLKIASLVCTVTDCVAYSYLATLLSLRTIDSMKHDQHTHNVSNLCMCVS